MLNKLFEGLKTVVAYVVFFTVVAAMGLLIGKGLGKVAVVSINYIHSITPINYEEEMSDNLEATGYAIGALACFRDDIETEITDSELLDMYHEAIDETDPLLIKYIVHPYLMK